MKLHLLRVVQCVLVGSSMGSLSAGAETLDYAGAPSELVGKVAGQVPGFDSLTSEALLLVVFILLVLAVMAHRPKAP